MAGGVLAAFPPLFYTLTRGWGFGLALLLFTSLPLLPLGGAGTVLFYLVQCGLPGYVLALFLQRGKGGRSSLVSAVGIVFLLMVLVTVAYALVEGIDPHSLVRREIDRSIRQGIEALSSSGMSEKDVASVRDGIGEVRDLVVTLYPSMVLLWISFVAGFNLLILSQVRERLPHPPELGRLAGFRNPDPLVWVLIAAGFLLLLDHPFIRSPALNVLVVVCGAYFVQGIAVVTGLFDRFSVPPLLRSILYFIVIVQPWLVLGLTILGLFDVWGDFRTPRKPKNL